MNTDINPEDRRRKYTRNIYNAARVFTVERPELKPKYYVLI
jgi:hypothetical protein